MTTITILRRRDAASVIVAIALGLIGAGAITALSTSLAQALTGTNPSFTGGYLVPMLVFLFQLVLLETGLRLIIFIRASYLRSK